MARRRQARRYPKLAQRAERQTQRELAPERRATEREIAGTRQEIGRAQRQGQRAAGSARRTYGRQAAYERGLARNLPRGVATPGLVQRQLMAGAAQTARAGLGVAGLAQRAAQQDVRGLRSDITTAQQELADEARFTAAEKLAEMVAERREAQRERKVARSKAKREALFQISRIPKAEGGAGLLHSQKVRDKLAEQIGSTEGIDIDPNEARQIVERLYRRLLPELPPGVLSTRERRQQSSRE